MAQGSRQVQTQAQQQVQTLSPQQILVVKLLELPAVELEDRIHAELLENPALEEGKEDTASDDFSENSDTEGSAEDSGANEYDSLSDYLSEDDIPDYKLQENNRSKGEQAEEIPFSDATSFYETLKEQLSERDLTEHQRELAEYLIGSLDDDGLLRKSLDSICDELAIYAGIECTQEELEEALKIIQDFDPAGLGARNLQECLLIQIHRKIEQQHFTPSPLLYIEEAIISECYEEFTRKHWDKIQQKLGLEEDAFEQAIKEICKLNPRPGASLGEAIGRNMQQIIPDFIVDTYDDGTINLALNNRNVPELRMSRDFTEMVEEHTKNRANQSKESKEAMMFLKQKMDAAQGFIDAVKQRQNTLMTTMQAIIDLQRPFFLEGDESLLRPMILKDVAERTGLDISTISRVSNSKYVQTNYGIYSLKFFFSDGYVTEDGEEMSVREIRKILKECIDNEDKKKPYTDDELTDILKEKRISYSTPHGSQVQATVEHTGGKTEEVIINLRTLFMEEQHIVADRTLIRTARVISAIFTPFSIPFLAFLILFLFSYLRIMPIQYKLIVLGVVYCFTILMPTLTIFLFRKINGFSPEDLGERKRRFMPFLLTITSYVFCLVMMHRLNIPWYMTGIILAALIMMVICIVVNLKWKLSEHMAGVGAIVGGLVSFSALFGYNPVWWLCLFILIAGVLGTARIILQHHTLGEVLVGFAVGLICSLLVLHPLSNILFRIFLF